MCAFICISISLSVFTNTPKSYKDISEFLFYVGRAGQRKKLLHFGKDQDHILDTKKSLSLLDTKKDPY